MSDSIGKIHGSMPRISSTQQDPSQVDPSQVQQQMATMLQQLLSQSTSLSPSDKQQLNNLLSQAKGSTPLAPDQQQQLEKLLNQAIGPNGMQQLAGLASQAQPSTGTPDAVQQAARKHHGHHGGHKLDPQDQAAAASLKSQLKDPSISDDDRQKLVQQLHDLYQKTNSVDAARLDGMQSPTALRPDLAALAKGLNQV